MMRVTRRYRFSASHRLNAPQLDAETNLRLYGKCNNPYGHGHNYELEVSARGPLDPLTGRVLDPRALDALVERSVLNALDHRDLNSEVEPFRSVPPTSENLGLEIFRRLQREWRCDFQKEWPRLERISIAETSRNVFEAFTDESE